MKTIKIVFLVFLAVFTSACSNEKSLQKYFVEKSSDSDFINLDLAPALLQIDENKLQPELLESFKKFNKVNILALPIKDSVNNKFDIERNQVKQILSQDRYQDLMKFGSGKNGLSLYYIGSDDKINEIIVHAQSPQMGFVVIRVLGDQMTSSDVFNFLNILKTSNLDLEQFSKLKEMF